jgi:uncharacterized protein involved in exopolysaccharide biosynthesis
VGLEKIRKVVPDEADQKIDLQTYWKIFWRKKFYFVVPIILSLVISTFGVRWLTPLYESSSLLAIEEQNILERTMERYITTVEERSREINMQYRAIIETRLKSRGFLESVAKNLGLDTSPDLLRAVQASEGGNVQGIEPNELLLRHLVSVFKDKITVQSPNPGFFIRARQQHKREIHRVDEAG